MAYTVIPSQMVPDAFDSDLFRQGTLDGLFGLGAQTVDDKIGDFFLRQDMNQRTVVEEALSGLSQFEHWNLDAAMNYGSIEEMWKVTIGYADYSKGVEFNRQTVQDVKYGLVEKAVTEFGYMSIVTMQQLAVDWLEGTGTSDNGAPQALANQTSMDSLPIFSAAHTLSSRAGSPTYSNLISGQVTVANMRKLLRAVRNTPNHLNVPGNYEPDVVWCHPDREDEIAEILFSSLRSDTANNALNTFGRNWKVTLKTWKFLDDTNAVYAMDSKNHGLRFYDRMGLTKQVLTDPETWSKKYQAAFAVGIGAIDWRGIAKLTGS